LKSKAEEADQPKVAIRCCKQGQEKGKINQIAILIEDYFKTKEEAIAIYNALHPELYALSIALLNKKS
jgi:hypothetical protein